MSDAPVPISLDDNGTRFKHLTDLQDHWALGVEVRKSMMKRFPTKSDELSLAKLEAAVELLKIHIDALASKARHMYKIGREVDSIAKIKTTRSRKSKGKKRWEAMSAQMTWKLLPLTQR
jgi:hypothetical protein